MKKPTYPRKPPVVVTLKKRPTLVVTDPKIEAAAKLRAELKADKVRGR